MPEVEASGDMFAVTPAEAPLWHASGFSDVLATRAHGNFVGYFFRLSMVIVMIMIKSKMSFSIFIENTIPSVRTSEKRICKRNIVRKGYFSSHEY